MRVGSVSVLEVVAFVDGSFSGGTVAAGTVGFWVASVSPLAGPIFNSEVEPLPFSCGAGSSPDSVDGFFEERDVSDGEDTDSSDGTTKLVAGLESLDGMIASTMTFPYMSIGTRRVTIRGTS